MLSKTTAWLSTAIVAGLLLAAPANAQVDPESGDTGEWQPPPPPDPQPPQQQTPPPQPPPQQNTWQQPPAQPQQQAPAWGQQQERPPGMGGAEAPPTGDEPEVDGDTDHSQVSFGLTFFGLDSLDVEPRGLGSTDPLSMRIPLVGIRYWVAESIGLDIGIGLGILAQEDFVTCDGDCGLEEKVAGVDGGFGVRLHVGLPVALQTYEHFNVLLIPEVGVSYAQATFFTPGDDANADVDLSTFALDIGLRVGGELQFGFWGVPNLALQATIGLGLRYQTRGYQNTLAEPAAIEGRSTDLSLRTIADDLGSTIRILYYF